MLTRGQGPPHNAGKGDIKRVVYLSANGLSMPLSDSKTGTYMEQVMSLTFLLCCKVDAVLLYCEIFFFYC